MRTSSSPTRTLASPPVMCTVISPSAASARPQAWAAWAAATAPVPHASVMPAPRSWTRMVMASRPGPGGHDLEVDVGHLGAEGGEVDGVDVVDGDDGVGVAERQVGDRAGRVAAEARPSRRAARSARRRPWRRWPGWCGRRGPGRPRRPGRPASVAITHGRGGERGRAAPRPGPGSGCRCRSSRPGEPSALCSTMPRSAPVARAR